MNSHWLISVAITLLASAPTGTGAEAGPQQGYLRVVVNNLASDRGNVRIYVHEESTFNSENLSKLEGGTCLIRVVAEICEGEAVWTSDALPYGQYAIIVHHDVNGDGAVNFGKVLPLEAVGYSNYNHAIASYPDFDKARVTLNGPALDVRVDAFMQGRLFRKYLRE